MPRPPLLPVEDRIPGTAGWHPGVRRVPSGMRRNGCEEGKARVSLQGGSLAANSGGELSDRDGIVPVLAEIHPVRLLKEVGEGHHVSRLHAGEENGNNGEPWLSSLAFECGARLAVQLKRPPTVRTEADGTGSGRCQCAFNVLGPNLPTERVPTRQRRWSAQTRDGGVHSVPAILSYRGCYGKGRRRRWTEASSSRLFVKITLIRCNPGGILGLCTWTRLALQRHVRRSQPSFNLRWMRFRRVGGGGLSFLAELVSRRSSTRRPRPSEIWPARSPGTTSR